MVYPGFLNKLVFFLLGVDKLKVTGVGMHNQAGVGMECHHYRFASCLFGQVLHPIKNLLVAQVYAVKSADGYHRVLHLLKIIKVMVYFH